MLSSAHKDSREITIERRATGSPPYSALERRILLAEQEQRLAKTKTADTFLTCPLPARVWPGRGGLSCSQMRNPVRPRVNTAHTSLLCQTRCASPSRTRFSHARRAFRPGVVSRAPSPARPSSSIGWASCTCTSSRRPTWRSACHPWTWPESRPQRARAPCRAPPSPLPQRQRRSLERALAHPKAQADPKSPSPGT